MTAPSYDDSNVFAKILRGELPAERLYEDEHTLAIMDIMPRGAGHCLVIPKAPARNILDVELDSLSQVMATTQKMVDQYFHMVFVVELSGSGNFGDVKRELEALGHEGDYAVSVMHERVFRFMHRV